MKLSKFEKKMCLWRTVYAYMIFMGVYSGIKILETGILTVGIAEAFMSCVILECFYMVFYLLQERGYWK